MSRRWHAVEPVLLQRIANAPETWADTLPRGTSEWTAPDCDDIAIPPVPGPAIRVTMRRHRLTRQERWSGAMTVVVWSLVFVAFLMVWA